MTAPTITIEFIGESDLWQLMATSFTVTNPAGPRLFRGGELPQVQWLHEDESTALADAAKLQAYVTAAWAGKAPKAKGREEKEVRPVTLLDFSNAVWNC